MRAPNISPRRRVQNNNKNGGGGNNKNQEPPMQPTPAPTQLPSTQPSPMLPLTTFQPSIRPPSTSSPVVVVQLPTDAPSLSPVTETPSTSSPSTSSPSTSSPSTTPTSPTVAPSTSPTQERIIGYMNITFSLLSPGVTATSVLVGQQETLVDSVKESLDDYLCTDTDLTLFTDSEQPICPSQRQRKQQQQQQRLEQRHLQDDVVYLNSILYPDQRRMILHDRVDGPYSFTVWVVEYPVLQVGTKYRDMAVNTSDPSGLVMMESVAQLAIDVRIEGDDLDERLSTATSLVVDTAIVGSEVTTWMAQSYFSPLDPSPFHPLRVAGMALFVFSFLVTCFIVHLSKKRRIQKEWDAEFKERGKGGLVTEAGVDYILEAARHQSAHMVEPEESSSHHRLPLPGYMNVATTTTASNSANKEGGGRRGHP